MSGFRLGQTVQSGQPWEPFNADAHTTLLRMGAEFKQGQKQSFRLDHPATFVKALNSTGAELLPFQVAGIGGFAIPPANNQADYLLGRLKVIATDFPDHNGEFLIAAERIPVNAYGLFYFSGIAPVKVQIDESWFRYADVKNGDATKLEALPHGSARIVAKENITGTDVNCVVQLGGPREHEHWGKPVSQIAVNETSAEVYLADDTGTVSTYQITEVSTERLHTKTPPIETTHWVRCVWDITERKWFLVHAVCP